jgi:chromate transporter
MAQSDRPESPERPDREPEDSGARHSAPRPPLGELMIAFAKVSLSGFGGVLPWWRRMLVEDKGWMTADEFNKLFAMCQFLPGPNVVNMAAVYGLRLYGVLGAIAAVLALALPPIALMIVVGLAYARFGAAPGISGALAGLSAGVAGLMIATALRIGEPIFKRRLGPEAFVAAAAFVAIGILRLPLLPVLAALAPASIALAWWMRR